MVVTAPHFEAAATDKSIVGRKFKEKVGRKEASKQNKMGTEFLSGLVVVASSRKKPQKATN